MSEDTPLGHLKARYAPMPSYQMVVRKYKPLNEQYIRDFFERGVRCTHIPEFEDDNEGMIESPVENPALRGGAAAIAGRQRRREGDGQGVDFSEEDFREQWAEFHERAREKYFASCWQLGTREFRDMWSNYASGEELKEGIAFETTVGQFIEALPTDSRTSSQQDSRSTDLQWTDFSELYVGGEDHDIHVGAVRYQEREAQNSVQPTGYQESVNFFKGSAFDYEVEFRLLINPFGSANLLRLGKNGVPISPSPEIEDIHPYFPMNTPKMVNRIVLAPAAGDEERALVENVLDDFGISYGPNPEDDLQIVDSNLCSDPQSSKQPYAAEFRGTANYDQTETYLEKFIENFLNRTEVEKWGLVDFTEITPLDGGLIVEGYRHTSDDPEIKVADYGHDGLQSVFVNRRFWNENLRDQLEEGDETDS